MDIQTARLLGIIGAFLLVIGIIPSVGGILIVIGIILVLIALKGYADTFKEDSIFNNALYTLVFQIIGIVICIAIFLFVAMDFLASLGINNIAELSSWQQIDWQNAVNIDMILPYVVPVIIGLVVLFAFTVFAFLYFRKSMNTLSEKTTVPLFRTTGTVFFVGAILTIIGIGVIILWIAFILLLISFYKSKPLEQPK